MNATDKQPLPRGAKGWYVEILKQCKLSSESPVSILTLIAELCRCMFAHHLAKSVPIGTVQQLALNDPWKCGCTYSNTIDAIRATTISLAAPMAATMDGCTSTSGTACPHFGFYCNDTTAPQTKVPLERWTHLAFVYNKETQQQLIYVDGQCVAVGERKRALQSSANNMVYFSNYAGGRVLNGAVRDVRIWNCARNEQDINALMYTQNNAVPAELYAKLAPLFWFDEGEKHELIEQQSQRISPSELWID